MIMMLYRIYKRLRPRQCRQFSNVHGYHSKSTFRVLIKQNYVILYLLFMVLGFVKHKFVRIKNYMSQLQLLGVEKMKYKRDGGGYLCDGKCYLPLLCHVTV